MCLIHHSRLLHLTIPINTTINLIIMLNIIQLIIKPLMRMHNLTSINPPNISLSIKVNITDNSSMQGMTTITLIINNMNKLTKEDNIIEKRITLNFLDKNNYRANQLLQLSQMIF